MYTTGFVAFTVESSHQFHYNDVKHTCQLEHRSLTVNDNIIPCLSISICAHFAVRIGSRNRPIANVTGAWAEFVPPSLCFGSLLWFCIVCISVVLQCAISPLKQKCLPDRCGADWRWQVIHKSRSSSPAGSRRGSRQSQNF